MGDTMNQQFNEQNNGPQDVNEALQMLAAIGQTDPMVMQCVQIVYGTLVGMSQQLQSFGLSLQFNGFIIEKLVEKAKAGEIDDSFDFDAFVEAAQVEFEELLNSEPDDNDSFADELSSLLNEEEDVD